MKNSVYNSAALMHIFSQLRPLETRIMTPQSQTTCSFGRPIDHGHFAKIVVVLEKLKPLPSYQSRSAVKSKNVCHCKDMRYILPCIDNIPSCLKDLTHSDILALRAVDWHIGDYKRMKHDYRQKNKHLLHNMV